MAIVIVHYSFTVCAYRIPRSTPWYERIRQVLIKVISLAEGHTITATNISFQTSEAVFVATAIDRNIAVSVGIRRESCIACLPEIVIYCVGLFVMHYTWKPLLFSTIRTISRRYTFYHDLYSSARCSMEYPARRYASVRRLLDCLSRQRRQIGRESKNLRAPRLELL